MKLSNQLLLNYFQWGHDDIFLILGPDRTLTLKRVKQGISNLVHKLAITSFNRLIIITLKFGVVRVYITIFLIFETPWHQAVGIHIWYRLTMTGTIQRMVNYPINMM